MKETIANYWYIIVVILIAIIVSAPYWKALKLSRAQKAQRPFPRSVLVAATIGFILGVILGIIILKYTVSGWVDIFPQLIFTLFFFGALMGLIVALKTGGAKIFAHQAKPEVLAVPVEKSWALTTLTFIVGAIAGILVSLILIMIA
jgi:hypothetical protein